MPTKPKPRTVEIIEEDPVGPPSDETYFFPTEYGDITLPSLSTGPVPKPYAFARARADKDMMTMMVLMVRAKAGENADRIENILAQLDEQEFEAFFKGWNSHSGVTAGE